MSLFVYSPAPKVNWQKVAATLPASRYRFGDSTRQELILSHIKPEDAGRYECKASNTVGSSSRHRIKITVEGERHRQCLFSLQNHTGRGMVTGPRRVSVWIVYPQTYAQGS